MKDKGRTQPSLMERFKQEETKRRANKEAGLMDKFTAMKKTSEILRKNGINPHDVLTDEQRDDLADAEFLEKQAK